MAYNRRQFFAGVLGSIADGLTSTIESADNAMSARPALRPVLRPPGAVDELTFLEKCTRCTDCIDACPYDAIGPLGPEFADRALTPAVDSKETPCFLCEDLPCICACSTGALVPTERKQVIMGVARITISKCYQAQGQPCDYCVTKCPLKSDAIAFNERDLPVIHEDGCAGCGFCAYLCPADAIDIQPHHRGRSI
ncbi:MAG: 4Fe-4S dicluster domain-containing protein [Phycisphaeraceae bacterium]|jgi:ferredoxin-type protein NapG|nr:4Fe-4S dicluster domain-containing protein [Phycisphaeraceae bacterium]